LCGDLVLINNIFAVQKKTSFVQVFAADLRQKFSQSLSWIYDLFVVIIGCNLKEMIWLLQRMAKQISIFTLSF
jgi:hypothetical protein